MTNSQDGNDVGQNPNKLVKVGNKGRKTSSSIGRNSTGQSNRVAAPDVHGANVLEASRTNAAEALLKKKTAHTQATMGPSGLAQDKDADQQRTGVISSQNNNSKLKNNSELRDSSTQRPSSSLVSKSHSAKHPNNADELDQSLQQKEKSAFVERFDLNVPASRDPVQITVSNW